MEIITIEVINMNKLFLIETMLNRRNTNNKSANKGDEINRIQKRLNIIKSKGAALSEDDKRKDIIRNDFLNLVIDMNDYFLNNKCN